MLATGVAVISSCLLSPNRGNPQNIKTDGEMYITGFPVVKLKNVEATSLTPTFIIERKFIFRISLIRYTPTFDIYPQ